MTDKMPNVAMVLAAGLGTRMRSHRNDIPKPLVPIVGRTLIDRVLDKLVAVGVERAVVNVSYLGDQIVTHLQSRDDMTLTISQEDEPLETGGGITKALPLLGEEPFFVLNADTLWQDGKTPALTRLAEQFDPMTMDALLLSSPLAMTTGYDGQGDFILDDEGRVRRPAGNEAATHVFAGIQILKPELLLPYLEEGMPKKFSLTQLFHADGQKGWFERIYALEHQALWMHVGDAQGVREAEAALKRAA
jgi:MurNAc alpha-1-phosphate uridylyltransferase